MNRAKTIRSKQTGAGADRNARMEAEIGQILATEEKLIPSSGFMASVMESIRQEAALPPPIPFPWTWAVLGILQVGGVFGWGAFEIVHLGLPTFDIPDLHSLALTSPHLSAALGLPGLVLWGETAEEIWRPPQKNVVIVKDRGGLKTLSVSQVLLELTALLNRNAET